MTAPEDRFVNQELVKFYAKGRPTYPPGLFEKLASLTLQHERAWDVGTGNGQAAIVVAEHYRSVIATDISEAQLALAMSRPNITYAQMSATPQEEELERIVGEEGSVDLITVAAAIHWFDVGRFYPIVKHVLRKPGGVFATWTYLPNKVKVHPEFDEELGRWFERLRTFRTPTHSHTYRALASLYKDLPFPFDPVPGVEAGKGVEGNPEVIMMEKQMTLADFIIMLKSFSPVQVARNQGVDVLNDDVTAALSKAWGSEEVRIAIFPIYLLMGTVSTTSAN